MTRVALDRCASAGTVAHGRLIWADI